MRSFLSILASSLVVWCAACARPAPAVYPTQIDFLAGESGARIHHVRTGPDWTSPDVAVGETAYRSAAAVWSEVGRLRGDELDEPVAYVAGSVAVLEVELYVEAPGRVTLEAVTESRHAEPGEQTHVGRAELAVSAAGAQAVSLTTTPLSDVVDVLDLFLVYRHEDPQGAVTRVETVHPVALAWAPPIDGTPVYERTMLWASEWSAGTPSRAVLEQDAIESVENEIAGRMLEGVWALGERGYRYGSFDRPKEKDNQAHVFLDFRTAACGEFRGVLLALNEYHGVEANWVMMSFRKPSTGKLSMYETRELPGVGTEPKVWRFWNHVAVEVNGQVYDPSYGLYAPDWNTYEDDLFASYCYGEDVKCKGSEKWCKRPRAEGLCVDNPAGFDPADPKMGMEVWRGEKY